jgi:hypothetical protein
MTNELPPNWEQGKTNDGRIFYINHKIQVTQWDHPLKPPPPPPKGEENF